MFNGLFDRAGFLQTICEFGSMDAKIDIST